MIPILAHASSPGLRHRGHGAFQSAHGCTGPQGAGVCWAPKMLLSASPEKVGPLAPTFSTLRDPHVYSNCGASSHICVKKIPDLRYLEHRGRLQTLLLDKTFSELSSPSGSTPGKLNLCARDMASLLLQTSAWIHCADEFEDHYLRAFPQTALGKVPFRIVTCLHASPHSFSRISRFSILSYWFFLTHSCCSSISPPHLAQPWIVILLPKKMV